MASVFLSYDRDDADRARPIAHALEEAGHQVWWDPHIKGGEQYSRVIDEALSNSDAVVVLWSKASLESVWVRDEAAVGRDGSRLIPVLIELVQPPLGFRQYQTIDLSRWRCGEGLPDIRELLISIAAFGGGQVKVPTRARAKTDSSRSSRTVRMGLGAVVVIAAIALAFFLFIREEKSSVPVVSVAASDNSPAAQSIADDLFVKLGSLQSAKADALQLVEHASDTEPDLRFRVGQRVSGGQIYAAVVLLAGNNDVLLWSSEFQEESRREADLRQQIAYSVARVLDCATEAMSAGERKLEIEDLKLYLNGCAGLSAGLVEDPDSLVKIFTRVTERAPEFAGGWAKLVIAETETFVRSRLRDPIIRRSLHMHIQRARKLDPTMAETYLAEAWLQPPRPINGWMPFVEEAVRKNPQHAAALATHAMAMVHVGRLRQAVDDTRRAIRSDPLSPSARVALIGALADSGQTEAAMNALNESDRLWPGASNLIQARFNLISQYGDPHAALKILRSGALTAEARSATGSFLEARADPTPAKIAQAINAARAEFENSGALSPYVQALAVFGRNDQAARVLLSSNPRIAPGTIIPLFRPAYRGLRNDPKFMAIAKRYGVADYWQKTGNWPDFCAEPDLPYDCKAEAAKLQ